MAVKHSARKLLEYARARLWDQTQWPDPDVIHRRSGMIGLAAFIQQTWDPELTKELLSGVGALSLYEGMRWAVEVNALARTGTEITEGVRAFLEKREPAWRN